MNLLLSPKHGVNPSLDQCFYCGKDKGVILFGKLREQQVKALREAGLIRDEGPDPEAPRKVCLDRVPCDECSGYMDKGIIFISVDEKKSTNLNDPWRTGGWVVLSEDFVRRTVSPPELRDDILKRRVAFVPDDAWDMMGLPRGEQAPAQEAP